LVLVRRVGGANRFGIGLENTDYGSSRKVVKFGLYVFFHRQHITFCSFINSRHVLIGFFLENSLFV